MLKTQHVPLCFIFHSMFSLCPSFFHLWNLNPHSPLKEGVLQHLREGRASNGTKEKIHSFLLYYSSLCSWIKSINLCLRLFGITFCFYKVGASIKTKKRLLFFIYSIDHFFLSNKPPSKNKKIKNFQFNVRKGFWFFEITSVF